MQCFVRRALAGSVGLAATIMLAGTSVPAAADDDLDSYPDLIVSAAFDQPAYDSGDVVGVTVTITNVGSVAAEDVWASTDWASSLWLEYPWWGDLEYGGATVRIEPGASHVAQVRGTATDPASGLIRFSARVMPTNFDWNPDDNTFAISAPVRMTSGDVGGTVIDDRNANGLADPGEGVPNVRVLTTGGNPYGYYERVTDVHGQFLFEDLPSGIYQSAYFSEDGWVVGPDYPNQDTWTVDETGLQGVVVLAIRPLSDKLLVTAAFTEQSYQVGDEAHVALTIRNKTGSTVTGIHAHCNGIGDSNQFNGTGPGWAPFDQSGPGVTLAAGESRTFDVYEPVPDGALPFGYVMLGCEIGPGAGTGVRGLPEAVDRAKAPGMITTVPARLVHDANGDGTIGDTEGIPNTRVTLLDYGTHTVVARATSDAQGRFQFTDIPTGLYVLNVIGPWQPQGSQTMTLQARPNPGGYELVYGMEPRGS